MATGMATIPRDQWSELLADIGRQHEGWVVAVERIETPLDRGGGDEPPRALELHESTLDAVDVEIDEDESTVIVTFTDNEPLHIENLARVSYDEVEEQDGKIVDLEMRDRRIIRLWLRMPEAGANEDLTEGERGQVSDEPPPAESLLRIKPAP